MRGLPGNIDVQGGFGAGKIAIKGSIGTKGTALQITSEGPDVAVFGPYLRLPLPSGGPYALNAKVGTQRNGLKVEVPSLKVGASELSGDALFRADRSGTPIAAVNIDAAKIDLGGLQARRPRRRPTPGTPPPQRRFLPTTPLQASWLGRDTISVTVRVGELTGLSGKISNGSLTCPRRRSASAFRGAASVGGGSAGFDLVYDPHGPGRPDDAHGHGEQGVDGDDLGALLGLDLGLRMRSAISTCACAAAAAPRGDALNSASGVDRVRPGQGRLARRRRWRAGRPRRCGCWARATRVRPSTASPAGSR